MTSFFQPGPAADRAYLLNRDEPKRKWLKDIIETLWAEYKDICGDRNFLSQAKSDFHGCIWAMQVAHLLRIKGVRLEKAGARGPDISASLKRTPVLVEAISLKRGSGPDQVPEPVYGITTSLPEEPIILRIVAAIKEKHDKYQAWVESRVVGATVPYVVAINAGMLRDADITDGISYLEKAVFAIGKYRWVIEVPSGKMEGGYHAPQPDVEKRNQSKVECDGFLSNRYDGISGILYTPHHIANGWERNGRDVIFAHNPNAKNPFPKGVLRLGTEKWVEKDAIHSRVWHHHVAPVNFLLSLREAAKYRIKTFQKRIKKRFRRKR